MKYWLLKLLLVLTLMDYSLCYAQQKLNTSYQNKINTKLNLSLFGKVKYFKQFSNYPDLHSLDTLSYIFDNHGLPVQIVKTSSALFYLGTGVEIYDFENGNLISEKYYENNSLLFGTNLKYDNRGNLIESSEYSNNKNLKRKAGKPSFIETYQYNVQGQQTVYTMDNISGDIYHKWIYKYDSSGNKIEEGSCENYKGLKHPTDCNYKSLHGYQYNTKNQLIKKYDIGNWSPHNTETIYQYDENGNEIDVTGYYITNYKVLGYHYVYQYDELGNKTREEEKTGDYLKVGVEEYKYQTMKYDSCRNIIQQEYYVSKEKQVKEICFVYLYDNFGNWIKREKYEGKTEADLKKVLVDERIIEYYQ
jgi:hypothetical protein